MSAQSVEGDTADIIPRYPLTYRKNEITLICKAAQEGQSLCFVGVAGTGKSNITNFLHNDPYSYKPHYLGKESGSIHFPVFDGNTWDGSQEGIWKQLLTALTATAEHLDKPMPDAKITQIYEDQKAFSELRRWVNWLCQEHDQKIMLILDDFDQVIQHGPLALLEQFNALRSDGNRGRLSYLIFTKRLPHILGSAHSLKGKSKFYDLFNNQIYSLGLYDHDDAEQMLTYLNENAGRPLRRADLAIINGLAGGHARLTKLLFDLWRAQTPDTGDYVSYFLGKRDIHEECARILAGLHEVEQQTAIQVATNQNVDDIDSVVGHLVRRGLLTNTDKWTWFSRLFERYLRSV